MAEAVFCIVSRREKYFVPFVGFASCFLSRLFLYRELRKALRLSGRVGEWAVFDSRVAINDGLASTVSIVFIALQTYPVANICLASQEEFLLRYSGIWIRCLGLKQDREIVLQHHCPRTGLRVGGGGGDERGAVYIY